MRIVIVGASLAGLRAAETLREEGFRGEVTVVGDERHLPYDRPALSKASLTGRFSTVTTLPRRRTIDGVTWRLGVAAVGLDVSAKRVRLADGAVLPFDRVLLATGARARSWHEPNEAQLDGVLVLRGRDDAARLRARLAGGPRRVLVIGGGFTGSEIASACCELGLAVTLVEHGAAPLIGALGGVLGARAAALQRASGVDLRCGARVTSLEGDARRRLRCAHLSDGARVEADVAVVALGAVRNTEWLAGAGLASFGIGVACDAGCRAIADNGIVTDDVFVAGDVARFPHPLYRHQFLAVEHWGNAVEQAAIAAHNMICEPAARRAHLAVPAFWSSQFGVNVKSVGVPSAGDEVAIAQGSLEADRFVAVYGKQGRTVAAVTFNHGRWLGFYQRLIERSAPFPPVMAMTEGGCAPPVPAAFPDARTIVREATAILTGYDATERRVEWVPAPPAAPEHRAPTHA